VGAAFRRFLSPFKKGERTGWTEWTERTKMPGRRPAFRRRQSGKMNCRRGVIGRLARKMVVLNYTHLHAFTRLYTKFLAGIHHQDAETQSGGTEIGRKRTQRTQKGWEMGCRE